MANLSTQQFLEVGQIKEGIIILKNRTLRGILMVSSVNFALKSEEEQNAIIYQFQDFINSLDFSLEIVVQSRRLNITGYLDKLKELENRQDNKLLRTQTTDYRKFIQELITKGSIMSKNFFVVIPFIPFERQVTKKVFLSKPTIPTLTEEKFQRAKHQLWQRMEFISLGLRRCGLQASILRSPEVIELLWGLHHPEEAEFGYYPEIPPELMD
jgi:type IV secretory pathway VirB4 component